MTIQKLERVMWRIRSKNKTTSLASDDVLVITKTELHRAIMVECGTCNATVARTTYALKTLGWIKKIDFRHYCLTNRDLTGDY